MIYTTLNHIRAHGPCEDGWKRLLKSLDKTSADDEPLAFLEILKSNEIDDALWCLRAEPQHASQWRLFAVAQVRKVQHLLKDPRSIEVLGVAERFAKGGASEEELRAAKKVAEAASRAAFEAAYGTTDWATHHATRAAYWTISSSSFEATYYATRAAYWAASEATRYATRAAYWTASSITRASQAADFEALLQKWEAAPGEAAVEILPTEA